MTILVTGGAGFIGSHLVDELLRAGASVRVLDNLRNGKRGNLEQHRNNNKLYFVQGDVIDPEDVKKAITGVHLVFHLACLGVRHSIKYPFENHRVNAEGTLCVLEAARTHAVEKFIYCSSSEVYGTARCVPMTEEHPARPCTVYGASKLAGEAYARAYFTTYAMNTVIVRPFNTYGPRSHYEGDAGELIPKTIVRALNGKPVLLFGDGKQTRDFTYVEDIARAFVRVAQIDDAVGETFNIGSNFEIEIRKVAEQILQNVKNNAATIKYTEERPGDVLRLYADSAKFRALTQWSPSVGLQDGLRRTIEWFRSRPGGVSALLNQEAGLNWR
jgi:UDP-glucose 4-epimerase